MKLANRIQIGKHGEQWGYRCFECYGSEPCLGIVGVSNWSHPRACSAAQSHWNRHHAHKIQGVCPRCGNGLPSCSGRKPDGSRWEHWETCERYEWAADVCARCDGEMSSEIAA